MSTQWRRAEPSAWQRAMAARARGEQPDLADLEEARLRAQPDDTPGWVRAVAAKVAGEGPPAAEESKPRTPFEKRLMQRLGVREVPPDDAA